MMKQKFSDAVISYFLKGGVLMESKGENRIKINIPMDSENGNGNGHEKVTTTIEVTFHDISIRTVKENNMERA